MTLESLIAHANACGMRVNNLSQMPNGTWRANLRRDGEEWAAMLSKETCYEFGAGQSAFSALWSAVKKAGVKWGVAARPFFAPQPE